MNKKKLLSGLKTLAAFLIIALHIAPFYIMINMSLKSASERTSRWLPPAKLYIQNYFNAMETGKLLRALGNTFLIVLCAVVIIVVVGAMAAYPLSRKTTRRNRLILAVIVGIMMVPQLSVLVPLYKEMVAMGGINRYWGVILVSATFNLPMAIYMYSNFIGTIPKELDEAAMIDGCSRMQVFFRIILPSLKATTASVIIWTSVGIWNDYQFQLYFLQKPQFRTITLAITTFFTDSKTDMGAAAAAAFIVVLPPVLMYIALQKYFVQGAMDSAVK
ncbi:carbohydrate ABC transporter permease [Enterocloster asparagiformis]|uniref:ABC transporter, permease protein n=1 Tax=[Clostridium] asparagiforme DSM 15981 TaxID=518636 RepID=C0D4F8_9FIRM|nr:carbohydrate ABC transporter permease [Enterocloster asparagiformis]EEG53784.1 ABC transporter, permease protein [[Clostridium] asparagiforme DSM 15981]UWO78576.1 carbohydrate ABC transporter permease [[Clostridium] asparagiforme DSM 15981]